MKQEIMNNDTNEILPSYDGPVYRGPIHGHIEFIDPELADLYLTCNLDRNRKRSQKRINTISTQITNGYWRLNGATICFTESAELIDGQHRLQAIINADKGVWTWVIRGLPDDAFMAIDTGRTRNMADILTIKGEHNSIVLASSARLVHNWETVNSFQLPTRNAINADEIVGVIGRHPRLRDAVGKLTSKKYVLRSVGPSFIVAFYYLISEINKTEANAFYDHLFELTNLSKGHPVLALKKTLEELREANRAVRANIPYIGRLFIKTWNMFARGEHISLLKIGPKEDDKLKHLEQPLGKSFVRYHITQYPSSQ